MYKTELFGDSGLNLNYLYLKYSEWLSKHQNIEITSIVGFDRPHGSSALIITYKEKIEQ